MPPRRNLIRLDRRSRLYRRRTELLQAFATQLGGWKSLPPADRLGLESAVEQVLVAEQVRGRFLAGEAVSADDVVRSSRAADLALRRCGLTAKAVTPSGPSLDDYLATMSGKVSAP